MKFRQLLGFAFKNWTLDDCKNIMLLPKEYNLGIRVAKYVALKKFNTIL